MLKIKENRILKDSSSINGTETKQENIEFQKELILISYKCRNAKYKKAKIVFTVENNFNEVEIVGQEYIIPYLNIQQSELSTYNKWIKEMAHKMYELNADGYYIVTIQKRDKLTIGLKEKRWIKKLRKDLNGLMGYLAISGNRYSYIYWNNEKMILENNKKIDMLLGLNAKKETMNKPALKICIRCELDLVKLMKEIAVSNKFSILIGIDKNNQIKLIQEVYKGLLNLSNNQIEAYIQNISTSSNSKKIYIFTMDKAVFERIENLESISNYKLRCIAYQVIGGNIYILNEWDN